MTQKKILVVDDDPDVRLALQVRLKANHYDVVCAGDGVTSVSEAQKQKPDLIILDLGLPAGDGFSVLQRMQASERLASIPVIVLSGRDDVKRSGPRNQGRCEDVSTKADGTREAHGRHSPSPGSKGTSSGVKQDGGDAGPKNPSPSAEGVVVRDEGLDV